LNPEPVGCFETVTFSGELEAGKATRHDVAAVLEVSGAAPDNAVMVADSLERDVLGSFGTDTGTVSVRQCRRGPEYRPGMAVVEQLDQPATVLDLAPD
jgi:FMN phosphatase YigB (HAD superfamily)